MDDMKQESGIDSCKITDSSEQYPIPLELLEDSNYNQMKILGETITPVEPKAEFMNQPIKHHLRYVSEIQNATPIRADLNNSPVSIQVTGYEGVDTVCSGG